jgi:hypothetical protein
MQWRVWFGSNLRHRPYLHRLLHLDVLWTRELERSFYEYAP